MPPPLLIMKLAPAAGYILFNGSRAAGFFRIFLYMGTPQKLAKTRTKKAATPNRQAGATADTHSNTGRSISACMVIISPAGKCCKIQRKEIRA